MISERIFNEKIISAINEKAGELGIPEPLIDVIVGNFFIFLMNRVLLSEQSSFDKSLYAVYERGGVPCGWKGKYPDGTMLVNMQGDVSRLLHCYEYGEVDLLWKSVEEVYLLGGIPCGWDGRYPAGKLVVYSNESVPVKRV